MTPFWTKWSEIEWKGFGRTRGGFITASGRVTYPPRKPAPIVRTSSGGWCAPMTPLYSFMDDTPVGWDDRVEWHHVSFISIWDLLPTFRAERGGIRWIEPLRNT